MARPTKYKIVVPTLEKIREFNKSKTLKSTADIDWLQKNLIVVEKKGDSFVFRLNNPVRQRTEITSKDLDLAFTNSHLVENNNKFSCLPESLQSMSYHPISGNVTGELNSLLQGYTKDFDRAYLRLVQPVTSGNCKIGNFSDAIDLVTDQNVQYGVGYLKIEVIQKDFELLRISVKDKEDKSESKFLLIDSCQQMDLEEFQKVVEAVIQSYSFIFGKMLGGSCHIVSSKVPTFENIDRILFERKPKEAKHKNYIFDSMEIRENEFLDSYFLFPKDVLSKMCNTVLNNEKYERTLRILHEANMNRYSLSTSILYSSALETICSIVPISQEFTDSINSDRFQKSQIKKELEQTISKNTILNEAEKEFLIHRKLNSLNTPSNSNKLEAPFKYYHIDLPKKFKDALKYRNKYLHGTVPKGGKLGSFRDDDFNRGYELQFLTNVLVLKYVGYNGYVKNRSLELEYYSQKHLGKADKDIVIDQSLYYKV